MQNACSRPAAQGYNKRKNGGIIKDIHCKCKFFCEIWLEEITWKTSHMEECSESWRRGGLISVAEEFRVNKNVGFKTIGIAVIKVDSGSPSKTTAVKNHTSSSRQKELDTVSKCHYSATKYSNRATSVLVYYGQMPSQRWSINPLHPERCNPLKVGHEQHCLEWCKEHKNWASHQWSYVLFMEIHCSDISDSHCQSI
ncbi:hypothetical protein TNCV_1918661 [Trichonephila clavipes]|nr:hypothetical protein TNCV_1918661 [Trichonephila clavipes]